ncbi:integral membrane protein [Fonsecaea pedrosoi]|nr:integral membrane protein [Fonsecaea pedrosoi]
MAFFRRTKSEKRVNRDRPSDEVPYGYTKSKPTALRTFAAVIYLLSTVFLILVEIGNINDKAVIRSTYFLKIDLANIIPASVPNAIFINSIAQSIGLHDFYQVGLWNFCEGYNGEGITYCSPTKTLYWFNPVEIILDELLAGASITLPSEVIDVLDLVRLASFWMFSCFLVGTCLTFLCIFVSPLGFSQRPRWRHKAKRIFLRQLPISILTLAALLFTAVATLIATIMFLIFQDKFSGAADLNIHARLGKPMLAFMWIATGLNLIGFLMQLGTCCGVCCCTGRRRAVRRSQMTEAGRGGVVDNAEGQGEKTVRDVDSSARTDGSSAGAFPAFRRSRRG